MNNVYITLNIKILSQMDIYLTSGINKVKYSNSCVSYNSIFEFIREFFSCKF